MAQDFTIFPSMNFVDLGLYQFGREDCAPAHSFGPAIRNHFLFHYILSGKGTLMWQDGKGKENITHLKAGQGFLISPGQITTYVADDRLGILLAGIRRPQGERVLGDHRAVCQSAGLQRRAH